MANYHSDEWVMTKLQHHYDEACKIVPKEQIVGVFAVGSMNHGLDCKNSDVDSKCIVVPSYQSIVECQAPYKLPNFIEEQECVEIVDIRIFMQQIKEHSLTRVEVLFTPYHIINPKYQQLWQCIIDNREEIAYYNFAKILSSIHEQMCKYYQKMFTTTRRHMRARNQYGYVPKYLYQIMRLDEFCQKLMANDKYETSLRSTQQELLTNIKLEKIVIAQEQAIHKAKSIIQNMYNAVMTYKYHAAYNKNNEIIVFLDELTKQMVILGVSTSPQTWGKQYDDKN